MKNKSVRQISASIIILLSALLFSKPALSEDSYLEVRKTMVKRDIVSRGITNPLVIDSMMKVKRHLFVPEKFVKYAYGDHPLPIGMKQTISQPFIVALMTESIEPLSGQKVLEIGTGSGYQAAVLSKIVDTVYTIEIIPELAAKALTRLRTLGYKNIYVKTGDGFFGWPEKSPFDAIIVTAQVDRIPPALTAQLKEGGRMVLPLGPGSSVQHLSVGIKKNGTMELKQLEGVRFVPMTGEAMK